MQKAPGVYSLLSVFFFILCWEGHAVAQTVSLSLSSAAIAPGAAATLNLTLSGSANPASLQWTVTYPASSTSQFSIAAGSALTAAGKTLQCAQGSGTSVCIGSGKNNTTIGNGVLATVTITPSSSAAISVGVSSAMAASPSGTGITTSAAGGMITVTSVSSLSSITCNPSALTAPNTATCTVNLSAAAPSGGLVVTLSSSNTSLTVPSSVTVASGSTSASFTANAASVTSSQTATITATLNGTSKTASLTLAPPAGPVITVLHTTMCGAQTWPGACTIPATTAGSLLVVSYSSFNDSGLTPVMSGVTDNVHNTYQQVSGARSVNTLSGIGAWNDMWYSANTTAGVTSITVNPSTSETGYVFVWEISGVAAVDAAAVLNSQSATTLPSGAPLATSTAVEIVLAMLHPAPGGNPTGIHSGNPFTSDITAGSMGWAHLVTTAAGTYIPQWDQTTVTFAATTVAFKPK